MKTFFQRIKNYVSSLGEREIYTEKTLQTKQGTINEISTVLKDGKYIGKGSMGRIKKVDIIISDGKRKKIRNFAIKDFNISRHKIRSLEKYRMIKSRGIPTRNTYRSINGTNEVLLTIGTRYGTHIFSPNNDSIYRRKLEEIPGDITNKEEFCKELFDVVLKLSQDNIYVYFDSYFFIYNDKNQELKILIGDFDNVTYNQTGKNTLLLNIEEVIYFLMTGEKYFSNGEGLADIFVRVLLKRCEKENIKISNGKIKSILMKTRKAVLDSYN